jgi:hypothetical protein
MKGMVFTNFLEMVEEVFDLDMVDAIIEKSAIPNRGAFTAVGTYPHEHMVALVVALSESSGTSVPELLEAYGEYLFDKLAKVFPEIMGNAPSMFDFLSGLDGHIHVEVRKLYPDAELPRFTYQKLSENSIEMVYHSSRHMDALALGLMKGCRAHFDEAVDIDWETLDNGDVKFTLTRAA